MKASELLPWCVPLWTLLFVIGVNVTIWLVTGWDANWAALVTLVLGLSGGWAMARDVAADRLPK